MNCLFLKANNRRVLKGMRPTSFPKSLDTFLSKEFQVILMWKTRVKQRILENPNKRDERVKILVTLALIKMYRVGTLVKNLLR